MITADIASLVPFMKRDPEYYLDFIKKSRNRILFAGDTLIGQAQTVESKVQFVKRFLDEAGLQARIFRENYLSFHKRSLNA